MKAVAVLAAAALLSAQVGCGRSAAWRLPDPPSEQTRRDLGPVALALEGGPPHPVSVVLDDSSGATLGPFGSGGGGGAGAGVLLVAVLLVAVVVAVAVAACSRSGPSSDQVKLARTRLEGAVRSSDLPGAVRDSLAEELCAGGDVALAQDGPARTSLVVGRPTASLVRAPGSAPRFRLEGTIPFRLVRVADGATLHSLTLGFRSAPDPLEAWMADEGAPLRDALSRPVARLAERAVDELFRVERPALPPVGRDPDPVRPEFRWTALPAPPGSGVEDLTYQFRVIDFRSGDRIYVRDGLRECVHRMEEDLPGGRLLAWTVRASYRRNGALRVTPWTGLAGSDRDGDVSRVAGVPFSAGGTSAVPGSPKPGSASPRR